MSSSAKQLAEKACAFLSAATDPFHAVQQSILKLEASGYARIQSTAKIQPGGKYYYTVQNSTLVAFAVGAKYVVGGAGFKLIGGHTDSPNLRVKPRSRKPAKAGGTLQLGVECYGGGLWHTWFDRDLSLSGKVLVRQDGGDTIVVPKLVQLRDPVARVSTLCIHLQSAEERNAFQVNKEEHTSPIIGTVSDKNDELEKTVTEQCNGDKWLEGHTPALLDRLAKELNITVDKIADFDLSLYDTQPAQIGGINGEFIFSARLDNLATVFCAVEALAAHDPSNDTDVSLIVCFDHEEVGSVSTNGAGSPVIAEAVKRIASSLSNNTISPEDYAATIAKSFCLSIDQAHAIHPNYASKHEAQHSPTMNGGIVIKTNSNQRYTTNSLTGFVVRELGRRCGVPVQEFCVRNDCPCGSTIGPTIAALTGMRTVDAGMPQLSMHSCREVMGVQDLEHGLQLFTGFFRHFREIDDKIQDNVEM